MLLNLIDKLEKDISSLGMKELTAFINSCKLNVLKEIGAVTKKHRLQKREPQGKQLLQFVKWQNNMLRPEKKIAVDIEYW